MLICFPHRPAAGGPGSFQIRLESELRRRGWEVSYAEDRSRVPDLILVVGGTRRLFWLAKMKFAGVPIVFRLDGLAWIHRKIRCGPLVWVKSEIRNCIGKFIHAYLADFIIYQSEFVRQWWDREGWRKKCDFVVIHNGVDTDEFCKNVDIGSFNDGPPDLLCVEGTIDYSPFAIELLNEVAERIRTRRMRLILYGDFIDSDNLAKLSKLVEYRGRLTREQVPHVMKQVIYFNLDVNPACPNTVAEALASGVPVIAFDTGALRELVEPDGGVVVPYGDDVWELRLPSVDDFIVGIDKILEEYPRFVRQSRERALKHFSIDCVVDAYLDAFSDAIKNSRR